MNNSFVNIALFAFVAVLCTSAMSQDLKKEKPPVRITANLMILDESDRYIADMKTEDFLLFEDDIEQKIETLDRNPGELGLILVVDNSGSMRTILDRALKKARILITNLEAGDEAAIIRFVGRDSIEIVQDWTVNKTLLAGGLNEMFIEGGHTAVIDALCLSLEKVIDKKGSDPGRHYAIVLISDAEERASYHKPDRLFELTEKAGAQIFSLALTGDLTDRYSPATKIRNSKTRAENLVYKLALRTGGNAYLLGRNYSDSEMLESLKSIVTELKSQYAFSYISTNPSRDGKVRKLRVEFRNPEKQIGSKIFVRQSVVIPSDGSEK